MQKEKYSEINTTDPTEIRKIRDDVTSGKFFGFLQVDIHVPEKLKEHFEEFSLLFVVDKVPSELIPDHIKECLKKTERIDQNSPKLLGVCKAKCLLLESYYSSSILK